MDEVAEIALGASLTSGLMILPTAHIVQTVHSTHMAHNMPLTFATCYTSASSAYQYCPAQICVA